jgi:acetyl-CoA decarbonylase/synthase complex subunit delta
MDKMTQLLKLLEKTDSIEINEFRMDFEELELQIMPAIQQVVQRVEKQAEQKFSLVQVRENQYF